MTKVLFFIDTTLSSGGAEKVLRELVNNMDKTKFEITVHTVWPENAKEYLNPDIRYHSIFSAKNVWNKLRFRLETALGLTYEWHLKDDYDIEVAYLECAPTKILASSTNISALKLAWVHCDLKKITNNVHSFVKKSKKWYRKFDKVVCVSQNVKDSFVELFGNKAEVSVLYNTVDDHTIRIKAEDAAIQTGYNQRITFVTIGRMYKQKGYDRLLEAHRQLIQQGYDYDLWILGDGPDRTTLERFVRENGLQDSVHMPGFQKNPYPYMRKADAVVCSSYYEGFSTVVTEALILGKPVVTTPCSGMDELLGDSEFGLITQDSVEGIRDGMRKLLDEPQLRAAYAEAAKQRGRDFSKEKLVSETEDFLRRELAKKRGG